MKRNAVVTMRHFNWSGVRGNLPEILEKITSARRKIVPDLRDRDELPVVRKRSFKSAERVRDAAPFLNGRIMRIPAENDVPDEAANDAYALPRGRWRRRVRLFRSAACAQGLLLCSFAGRCISLCSHTEKIAGLRVRYHRCSPLLPHKSGRKDSIR